MSRTCQKCGAYLGKRTLCESCGQVAVPKCVVLTGDRGGEPLRMHITTTIGRRLLKGVAGPESRFASDPQFRIVKDPAIGWVIAHEHAAANPTYLNGAKVGVETPALEDGAVISIGRDRMRLTVRLEDA